MLVHRVAPTEQLLFRLLLPLLLMAMGTRELRRLLRELLLDLLRSR